MTTEQPIKLATVRCHTCDSVWFLEIDPDCTELSCIRCGALCEVPRV